MPAKPLRESDKVAPNPDFRPHPGPGRFPPVAGSRRSRLRLTIEHQLSLGMLHPCQTKTDDSRVRVVPFRQCHRSRA